MVRLGGEPESNFEDRTGQRGGFGGFGGGNALGCLIPLVASRFGIVGVAILLLGYCALTQLGGGGGILPTSAPQQGSSAGQSTLSPETRSFIGHLFGSTNQTWEEIFAKNGQRYVQPGLVAYSSSTSSGCGVAQAAVGPFYCPTDKNIYIDPDFFNELSQRFGAAGDFAQAYVIAHEVGHHVQDLMGTLDRASTAQARSSRVEGNQIQVGVELQADCYAGVWAANARDAQGSIIEPGDVEEGMRAAEAIGDDTLQRNMQGRVMPETFTHGTSAQRQAALQTGLRTGDPGACKF